MPLGKHQIPKPNLVQRELKNMASVYLAGHIMIVWAFCEYYLRKAADRHNLIQI